MNSKRSTVHGPRFTVLGIRGTLLLGSVAAMMAIVLSLAVGSSAKNQPAGGPDLAASIRRERDQFIVPGPLELDTTKRAVAEALQPLADWLETRPDGVSVASAIGLDRLRQQMQAQAPDVLEWLAIQRAMQRNKPGLTYEPYYRLRAAVNVHVRLLRGANEPGGAGEFNTQLEQMAAAWEAFAASRSASAFDEFRQPYRWLAQRGQAQALREQIMGQASYPNQVILISGEFINSALNRQINRPIRDSSTSKGARVNVVGTLRGRVKAALQPNNSAAVVRMYFDGRGVSNIVASKGPVTLCARGYTDVKVTADLRISDRGARADNSQVHVHNNVQPYAANLRVKSRLLRRIANPLILKIARRQRGKAGRDADRKVKGQVDGEIQKGADLVANQSQVYIDRLLPPALVATERAAAHHTRTTKTHLEWRARHASPSQLGAPGIPPPLSAKNAGAVIQLHESAANNSTAPLAGIVSSEPDFRELIFETAGLVPEDDDSIVARIPSALVFSDENPLDIRFEDEQIHVTLRLKGFESEEVRYEGEPWTVRTAYRLIVDSQTVAVERTAPIEVLPADGPQVARLTAVLPYFLVSRASRSGVGIGDLANLPELHVSQLTVDEGWLTLAVSRGPWPDAQVATVTQP